MQLIFVENLDIKEPIKTAREQTANTQVPRRRHPQDNSTEARQRHRQPYQIRILPQQIDPGIGTVMGEEKQRADPLSRIESPRRVHAMKRVSKSALS